MRSRCNSLHPRRRIERCPRARSFVHQRECQMNQTMGPPAYRAAGRAGADLSAEKLVNEPRRTAGDDAARASTTPRGKFYLGSAAALLLVVVVGFSKTFYLRVAF